LGENVFGRLRPLLVLLSSYGQQQKGRILTVDNLRRRGFSLANWCCPCKKNEEFINHLLIHCEYIIDLWHLVLNIFGASWMMPSNILELLHCWKFQGWGHPKEAIWKVISTFLMWSIWREKNWRLFEESMSKVLSQKFSILRSLLDWVIVHVPNFDSMNLVDLICFLDCSSL
jgi:hypothetical protein